LIYRYIITLTLFTSRKLIGFWGQGSAYYDALSITTSDDNTVNRR